MCARSRPSSHYFFTRFSMFIFLSVLVSLWIIHGLSARALFHPATNMCYYYPPAAPPSTSTLYSAHLAMYAPPLLLQLQLQILLSFFD